MELADDNNAQQVKHGTTFLKLLRKIFGRFVILGQGQH